MARKKFKFVEMFINPDTGAPFEGTGSPKLITPEHFPAFMGHQIAKIEYEERKQKEVTWKVKDGKAVMSGNAGEICSSDIIEKVFGVRIGRCETEHGFAYYYIHGGQNG